jgi:hypothetical protein
LSRSRRQEAPSEHRGHLEAVPVNDDQPLIKTDDLDVITAVNAAAARESFAMFRRTIRPDMLSSPFVGSMTRELQKFHDAFVAGKRPKLAMMTPPQHGKSWAAEDFMAWEAGKNPSFKTIYTAVTRGIHLEQYLTVFLLVCPSISVAGRSRKISAWM